MHEASEQDTHTRRIAIAITLAVLLAGGAWWYFTRMPGTPEAVAAESGNPVAAGQIIPAAPLPPAIQNPLDLPAETETAGTAKVDPDAAALSALNGLFGPALDDWLIPDRLLRRLVATTDNLGRNGRTESLRPLRAPRQPFAVKREPLDPTVGTERITLAPANYGRYDAAIALLSRVDTAQAVAVYKQLYPRLQRAWEDLGYPDVYFNDRVVEVIDHLLATPEPAGALLLEQPKVLYLFADRDLESRTAGQKLLLRIGVEHARVVKQKLREFRAQIAKE